jgi:acyl-CoA oxidase
MSDWDAKTLGGSIKRKIVNPELQAERDACAFDKLEFEQFIWGKFVQTYLTERNKLFFEDPELKLPENFTELTRAEQFEAFWRFYHNLMKRDEGKWFKDNLTVYEDHQISTHSLQVYGGPLLLHFTMFMQSIKHLGSEEQQKKYLQPAAHLNILGCYAQTELGHGSNVAGLETTATLDKATDEFVIHTPNIKATKFWPGALGL